MNSAYILHTQEKGSLHPNIPDPDLNCYFGNQYVEAVSAVWSAAGFAKVAQGSPLEGMQPTLKKKCANEAPLDLWRLNQRAKTLWKPRSTTSLVSLLFVASDTNNPNDLES